MSMVVDEQDGRDAWTSFRRLERFPGATLVEVRIHTGRTHQIRVHFQHIGYPLAGDVVYAKRQSARLNERLGCSIPRQMLHAYHLEFLHPRRENKVSVKAPLPDDFTEILRRLRDLGEAVG